MKNIFFSEVSIFRQQKSISFLLLILLILHLFWAFSWPLFNDESYYWDWARNMDLSYVDAPPAVSWVAKFSHIFSNSALSARILVPFLNLFSALFLIKSASLFARATKASDSPQRTQGTKRSLVVILMFAGIPIFSINGTMLMPDAPLIFACAGTLYFALLACEEFLCEKCPSLCLKRGCLLGVFIGLGVVSKYQGAPLAIGVFLAIACLRGFKNTFTKDFLFWVTTVLCALIVSSPLFLWNLQNNFASFKFQGQHGFSTWNLNIPNFLLYILAVIGVMLPWYAYLFSKQIVYSLKNKSFFRSLDCIPIFAFLSIFVFIGSAALGNKTEVHWITPGVVFLIPLVASNWEKLTHKHPRFWMNIAIVSCVLIIIVSSLIFTRPVQTLISQDKKVFRYKIGNMHKGLYGNLLWANIENAHENIKKAIPEIALVEKKYFKDLNSTRCLEEPYLASFSWRWTSQFAFYLKNNPRVFSFNLARTTYYSWRDSLPLLAGCRFFVMGPKSMYDENELTKIMTIDSIKYFTVPQDYTNKKIEMIFIDGVMKNSEILEKISQEHMSTPKY